ncbi:MAG: hypothetical protein GXP34_11660 [Actinobacteria bacterium]|nr:hypothetical protein [Actinomycetota bacterium]
MKQKKIRILASVAALALIASACSINVERNVDGSLQVTGEITAQALATEFERDPDNDSVKLSINDGVMLLDVEGVDENGEYVANLRIELSAVDGVLVVNITEAFYNGWTVPDDMRKEFNAEISKEIREGLDENPDATLVSLVADNDKIVAEWRVETEDSKKS